MNWRIPFSVTSGAAHLLRSDGPHARILCTDRYTNENLAEDARDAPKCLRCQKMASQAGRGVESPASGADGIPPRGDPEFFGPLWKEMGKE